MPNFNSIKHWIAAHRLQTAFHVAMGGVVLRPDVVSALMLDLPGFGKLGIRKDSIASRSMSSSGSVPAGGIYATMQSVGMGGPRSVFAENAVRVIAVASSITVYVISRGRSGRRF
ncbi:hypothetical protein IQ07DRAFT_93523 [Pyrenochaeta sp. DS3sAY3a]|nr:hypothetical protein IQ07DRAFT_93523 [Pyrenochaeta sp. DS3sAY3a]